MYCGCADIGAAHWYGGAEEMVQHFPLRRDNVRPRTAFLPGDMLQVGWVELEVRSSAASGLL